MGIKTYIEIEIPQGYKKPPPPGKKKATTFHAGKIHLVIDRGRGDWQIDAPLYPQWSEFFSTPGIAPSRRGRFEWHNDTSWFGRDYANLYFPNSSQEMCCLWDFRLLTGPVFFDKNRMVKNQEADYAHWKAIRKRPPGPSQTWMGIAMQAGAGLVVGGEAVLVLAVSLRDPKKWALVSMTTSRLGLFSSMTAGLQLVFFTQFPNAKSIDHFSKSEQTWTISLGGLPGNVMAKAMPLLGQGKKAENAKHLVGKLQDLWDLGVAVRDCIGLDEGKKDVTCIGIPAVGGGYDVGAFGCTTSCRLQDSN